MAFQKRTYVGKGRWHLREYGAAAPLLFVGNVSEATFSHNENKVGVPDFTTASGGEYDSVRRIDTVTLALTEWDVLNVANLARYTRGTATAATVLTAITNEAHTAYLGGLIPLNRIPNNAVAMVVTDTAGTTTYTEGTDYLRTPSGIEIPASGSAITEAQTVHIDYTPVASDTIEALTTAGKQYQLFFEGLNEADSGRQVNITVHKFKPGAATAMGWLSQEFLSAPFEGDVLKDTSIVGAGLSPFYKVSVARVA